MNGKQWAIAISVAALRSADCFAQASEATKPTVTNADVAVVSGVKNGVCEFCPAHHEENHTALHKDSRLKADDEVRCQSSSAYVEAYYLTKEGRPLEEGDFTISGETWQPVGAPGAEDDNDLTQPRLGVQASNAPKQGVTASTDPSKVASVEQRAQALQEQGKNMPAEYLAWGATTYSRKHATRHMSHASGGALGARVRKTLEKDKGISAKDITVQAKGSEVTLGGTVPDAPQREKAAEVAKAVSGVTSVQNRLEVRSRNR